MKIKKITSGIVIIFTIIVLLSSCVTATRVTINTDVEGATVYVDGKNVGTTPAQIVLSNAIWENPDVVLKKDGYKDLHTDLHKEVKAVNVIFGLLFWYPSLLWCYGPKSTQNFVLLPSSN